MLEKSFGAATITKDGVSVAKEIELADKFENMGAQMVKEVASKTSDVAGDGTTTATVLAQALIREGMKAVAAGMNPMDLKRGIDKAVHAAVDELKKLSKPTADDKAIAQVGTILANSDANCGEEPSVVLNKAAEGTGKFGYNAATGEYGDMIAFGILDPTKVTRSALQNAASIAGLMITTEAMVAEAPKKEEPHAHGAPGGGMGGMGGMDF